MRENIQSLEKQLADVSREMLISTRTEDEMSAKKDTTFIPQHFFTPKNKKTSALEDCKHSLQKSKDSKEDLIFKDDLPSLLLTGTV